LSGLCAELCPRRSETCGAGLAWKYAETLGRRKVSLDGVA
jgi:hypothetical protein